jgi:hypothetical protein
MSEETDKLDQQFNSVLSSAHEMLELLNVIQKMCQANPIDGLELKKFKAALLLMMAHELKKMSDPVIN